MLNETHRRTLLGLARESIAAALDGRQPRLVEADFDEILRTPSGVFVTLTIAGQLRGCIGSIEPIAPLYQAIVRSATNAAFRDPRFVPLTREELRRIRLEVSVMGPVVPVQEIEEIVVGRDGLIISRGSSAGLLLPQVATDYEWDRETFLSQTCVKAGLPPTLWRTGQCRIERFSAEVFGEVDMDR